RSSLSLIAGSTSNATVTLTSLHNLLGNVAVSVSLPNVVGLTASSDPFLTLSANSNASTSVSFYATASTPPGSYLATVRASFGSPGIAHSVNVTIIVVNSSPVPFTCPLSSASTAPIASSYTYVVGYCYRGEVLDAIRYPDGQNVSYTYDSLGRVSSVFQG